MNSYHPQSLAGEISLNFIYFDCVFSKNSALQIFNARPQSIASTPIKHNSVIYPHERIIISNKKLAAPTLQYFMLYKPKGMKGELFEMNHQNRAISKWIQLIANKSNENQFRLRLCGRLDIDCSGLILCTNDGIMTDLLKSPSIGVERTYRCDISRKHHENKFSNIWTLQTKGTQLRKDIGWIDAVRIKARGRLDDVDSLILEDMDEDEEEAEKSQMEKDKLMEQKISELKLKKHGDIPLKKELGHDVLDDKPLNEKEIVNEDEVEGIKGSDKYYRKYLRSLKRKTRWDITVKHGQHKVMKRMIKNLGFRVEDIERIGYGPFLIGEDGKDFKQWSGEHVIRYFDEVKEESLNDNTYNELYKHNCVNLNDIQVGKLWDTVGGANVGVISRLNSLLERANKLNDTQFMDWLKQEYRIEL